MESLAEFHFIRPWFLLGIVPAVLLCLALWRSGLQRTAWQGFIDQHLLKHLLDNHGGRTLRWPLVALLLVWIVSSLSLAGPAWQKLPQPVHQPEAAVVLLLDLSPSMMAEDLKPSRLLRTRYKVLDFLRAREEGLTALIAYAGEAHVVSPLTDDINTINNLMPALNPAMMPLPGSNIEMAVEMAVQLFTDAGINRGDIIAITDGIEPIAFDTIRVQLQGGDFRFSILGVGSTAGAPIPTGEGGFVRDRNRDIVVAKLNRDELRNLSQSLGGVYVDLRPDEQDVDTLVNTTTRWQQQQQELLEQREFDVWLDQGQWLVLLILPFAALAFRRGWLISIALMAVFIPKPVQALEWRDLWMRKDQQGQLSMDEGNPQAAAEKFESQDWRGVANYRAENYTAAAEAFAQEQSALADYNRGNALARNNQLEDALKAYESAMAKQENFEDAQFNHQLIKDLIEQQKQQQDQQSNQEQDQQGDQQQQNQQAQNDQQQQQNSEQQSQDQASQEGEQQNQQNGGQQQPIDEQAAQELAQRQQQGEELTEEEQQLLQQWQQQQAQQAEQNEERGEEQLLAERQHDEEQQALEQWLRQVPDDPSGLMRRKFQYQRQRRLREYQRNQWAPPENGALERY